MRFIDTDTGKFIKGRYNEEYVEDVVDEDPDYIKYLLESDFLESVDREILDPICN
jgi:hypothetical protein